MSLQPYARTFAKQLHSGKHVRTFAAAAAKSSDQGVDPSFRPREELKTSKVDGVTVASVESNKPISRIAVYFRAGSRFESDSTQGLVHMLRNCAGLGTSGASQFGLTRNIEQAGANLTCTSSREFIAYTIEASRNKIAAVDRYLQDAAANQVFKPWEVSDNVHRLRLERANRNGAVRVLELIHRAAFRKGLGYSIYSPKWMLGNHSSEMLSNFVKTNFVDASVVAVGVPHEQAVDFASRLNLKGSSGARNPAPGKFTSGAELRKETTDNLAYVALAIQGASLADPKKAVAAALVQRALGDGPRSKRGINAGGKLTSILGDAEVESNASAFSASYADTGIVGVYVAASPKNIADITKKAADVLRGAKFSNEDANRAKGLLKGDIALALETDAGLLENLGIQSLLTGKASSLPELLSEVDSVSAEDMNSIVKGGQLSQAVFGNVAPVPYLDQL